MPKNDYIRFRCSTELKNLVELRAKQYGMTVTNYIECLVRKDVEEMKVILKNDISKECLEDLQKSEFCFPSSNGMFWLISDKKYCDFLSEKYGFCYENKDDNPQDIYFYGLDDYCELVYDGEAFEGFGKYISLREWSDTALDVFREKILQNKVSLDKWDKIIDAEIKTAVMINVVSEMGETLKKLLSDGYDIALISSEIQSILK